MPMPSESAGTQDFPNIKQAEFIKESGIGYLFMRSVAIDPPDHIPIVALQSAKVIRVGSPCFISMQKCRTNTGSEQMGSSLEGYMP